jgi:hypothetical protein
MVPRSVQALHVLLAVLPRLRTIISRKGKRETVTEVRTGNQISIQRSRVIEFNAFLRIEKTKVTRTGHAPALPVGLESTNINDSNT